MKHRFEDELDWMLLGVHLLLAGLLLVMLGLVLTAAHWLLEP